MTANAPSVAEQRIPVFTLAVSLLAVLLVYRFFDTLAGFLLTAYAAAILATALNVILRRLPLHRKAAAALIGILLLGALVLAGWFIGSAMIRQLRDLLASLPAIESEVADWIAELHRTTGFDATGLLASVRRELREVQAGGAILGHARGFLHAAITLFAILFGALFVLAAPHKRLLDPLLGILPAGQQARTRTALQLLGSRMVGWLQGQLISMLTVGVLATIAFQLIGVPYALLLGTINGLLDFVPIAGPWIGGVPATVVAAVSDPMKGVWTALAITAIQLLENTVVLPLAMANRAKLHPFVTLFSLLLFGGLFGFMGMLLAVPLVLLIWTAAEVFWVERRPADVS